MQKLRPGVFAEGDGEHITVHSHHIGTTLVLSNIGLDHLVATLLFRLTL